MRKSILILFLFISFSLLGNIKKYRLLNNVEYISIKDTTIIQHQTKIQNSNFDFEKLIFLTSSCEGNCPIINLQITSDRKLIFYSLFFESLDGNKVNEEKSGNFIGKLDKEIYKQFINLLINSKFDSIANIHNQLCCDASIKTIVLFSNNKKASIEIMFPPESLKELILFLYEINTKVKLTRVNEKFNF